MSTASSTRNGRPPIAILGVPFDNVTTAETLALVAEMVASRQPHYVVTANVDFTVQAREDVELRRILHDAHLVVADGMPLVWASRWLGNPLPERVTGSGLTPLLLAEAENRGWRVFFLGGTEESVAQAATNTRAKHPRLQLVGAWSPPFKPLLEMDHEAILRRVREAKPDLLLVAFGCPKQEKWMNMHYRQAGVPVSIGVGATIDFLAGTMRRAPVWMQQSGLEWIYRMAQEPRRLMRRYGIDLWVFGRAMAGQLRELRAGRRARTQTAPSRCEAVPGTAVMHVIPPRRFDAHAVRAEGSLWPPLLSGEHDVLMDLQAVGFIDSTACGLVVRLQKSLRAHGKHLVLVQPSAAVLRAFELMRLSEFVSTAPDAAGGLALLKERSGESSVVVGLNLESQPGPVVWQGEITAVNRDEVEQATELQLATAVGRLEVHLGGVRFIDSSGIGLLVKLRKQAHRRGVDLVFIGPSETVRKVARLLRMEDYLFGAHA